jgi:hypothetical protein
LLTCWLLPLEEYGVTFEYLPGKKNVGTVADALSCLDIDSLKIQEEEVLTLLSGSENSNNSNIKSPDEYCLDLHRISKSQEIKRKGPSPASITQYNILKGMIFFDTKERSKFLHP